MSKEIQVLRNCLKLDKKVLVHHRDTDGISSASLFLKLSKFKVFSKQDPKIDDEFVKELIEMKPEFILFLDVSVDQFWEKMLVLKKELRDTTIMLIDHHVISKDLNDFDIIHINPRFEKTDSYTPTGKIVYDMLVQIEPDIEKFIWIAAIGVIGDHGWDENKEFIEKCREKYPELLEGNILESKLGWASKVIISAINLKGKYGSIRCLDALKKAEKFEDFEKNTDIVEWNKEIENELKRIMETFEDKKEIKGDVVVFNFQSEYGMISTLCNIISDKYPDKIVIVAKEKKPWTKVSLRAPNKPVDLCEIVKKAAEGIGYGGGHERAAGARVKDWEEFKKRVIELVNG